MAAPDQDQFKQWIFAKLAEYELSEFIPHDDLMKVSKWAAGSFYQDGIFKTRGFITGLNKDYNYPVDQLISVLGFLKNDAVHAEVDIQIPTKDELAEASPADSGPVDSSPSPAPIEPSPKFQDPYEDLAGFLQNRKYMGWAVMDQINKGNSKKAPFIQKALESHFRFNQEEKDMLRSIDSSTPADSLPALVLDINSMALAYSFAMDFCKSESELDIKSIFMSLRLVDGTFGEMASTVMLQYSNATKAGHREEAQVLDRAWKRLQALQDECQSVKKKLQKKEYGSSMSSNQDAGDKQKQSKKKGGWLNRLKGK